MENKSKINFLVILFIFWVSMFGTLETSAQRILEFDEYQSMVIKNHPIAARIRLKTELAQWHLTKAKGSLDPKLFFNSYQKQFDAQNQFSLMESGIELPTRSPIQIHSGIDLNNGSYLNPENKTGNSGLFYAGVSVNLLQGLFTDPVRTGIKKAELLQELTTYEQQLLLNDLLYYSGKTYWEWFNAYHNSRLYAEALLLAQDRFEFIRQSAALGDRPSFDTLESSLFYQNMKVQYAKATVDYENATLQLSVFFWDENGNPMMLDSLVVPPSPETVDLSDSIMQKMYDLKVSLENHPLLSVYRNKVENLNVDKKLYKEQIKPTLSLKYNFLSEGWSGDPGLSFNNYTWGVKFHFPVFLRRERANLEITDLEIMENEYELQYKSKAINAEFEAAYNQWELMLNQVSQWQEIVEYNRLLSSGESALFIAGESSIFMVNTRQVNYINARMKYLETISKYNQSVLDTYRAAGLINQTP